MTDSDSLSERHFDVEAILVGCEQSAQFQKRIPKGQARDLFRAWLHTLPFILGAELDAPATTKDLLRVKRMIFQDCLDKKVINAIIRAQMNRFAAIAATVAARLVLSRTVRRIDEILAHYEGFLAQYDLTDETVLTEHLKLGVPPYLIEASKKGTITIGGYLSESPAILLGTFKKPK